MQQIDLSKTSSIHHPMSRRHRSSTVIIGLTALWGMLSTALAAEPHADALSHIACEHLSLGGELGRRVDITITNHIKALEVEKRFTDHFARKNGPNVAGGFIGMGMLIDACTRFAAFSDDPDMIALKDRLIDVVIDTQLENGYSGFYRADRRLWDRTRAGGDNWDIHEMAFIIDGLLTDYELFGHRRSLDAAVRTADYILNQYDDLPESYAVRVDLHVLNTGIDGAILRLYKNTGNERFLKFTTQQKPLDQWDTDIVIGRRLGVSGHMFAYLAMCLAQQDLYRLTGDQDLLEQTTKAMRFLIEGNGLTITGSAGQREIWTDDQDGEHELGETCATSYQVRVYESLLRLTGRSQFGDLIERTLFNGFFAAQSPDGTKMRYYTPFEGPRKYYPHQHMCCPGNFRREMSEIPTMIYYQPEDGGIAINLYAASSAGFTPGDGTEVNLEQVTDYPTSGQVEIRVTSSGQSTFPILLRIPAWASETSLSVAGEKWNEEIEPGTFLRLNREWGSGDVIQLEFDMEPRFIRGRQRQAGRVALMRGPILYGLNLEANPEATAKGKRVFQDLQRILLDPATLSEVMPDDSVRPDGTAFEIKAWREDKSRLTDVPHEFTLKLTEFPDPGSQFIYFKVPDYSIQVEDELFCARQLYENLCLKDGME